MCTVVAFTGDGFSERIRYSTLRYCMFQAVDKAESFVSGCMQLGMLGASNKMLAIYSHGRPEVP